MVEAIRVRTSSKKAGFIQSKGLIQSKRAEGLPMYAIGVIIIGIIIVALLLMFMFGVTGTGANTTQSIFNIQTNVTSNANTSANMFAGK
jgi:hypothetical protein